ncbi:acyltransferase [Pseudoroseomonas globiformis]|uniref:Acyltransferase n=1 Tax=Teichococcus globiformis TaxID=2307229 RepID=A0ABV7G5P5_9PROT
MGLKPRRLGPEEAASLLRSHPRLAGGLPEGFSLPLFAEGALEIGLDGADPAELKRYGIVAEGPRTPGNRLLLEAEAPFAELRLRFGRADCGDNLFAVGGCTAGSRFQLKLAGSGHLFVVGGGKGRHALTVSLRTGRALFLMGRDSSSNGGNAMVEGPGQVIIGDDAMFAEGINIRNADSHGIVDLATGEQVNLPEDVAIGPHVWLAAGATVMKGVTVGRGSIVAAQAMVTRDVPPCSLVAGVPARLIREGVSWTRQSRPDAKRVAALRGSLGYG